MVVFLPASLAADITGTVLDPRNARVPGALVHLISGAYSRSAISDEAGRFRFPPPADGAYTLLAEAPGLAGVPQKISVRGGAASADVRLELAARNEVVVVTGESAPIPVSTVGSSVTVITRAQLDEMHAENVAEALRHVPGLNVVATGRRGGVTGIFARGGESDFNLVMVDGVKINAFGGAFDFGHLPSEAVERIELVRGPQSALYGLNAIGSVIHIITRRGRGETSARGMAEGGSFGAVRGSFGAGGRAGRFGWNFDLMHRSSDGVVPNDDYESRSGLLSLDYEPNASGRLRYTFLVNANERGAPGAYFDAPGPNRLGLRLASQVDRVTRGKENLFVHGLEFGLKQGRFHHKLTAGFSLDRVGFESPFGPSRSRNLRGSAGAETQFSLAENDVLAFGFEFQRERFLSSFVQDRQSSVFPLFRNNLGWYVENRYERGARFFLNTGVRLENIRTSTLPPDLFGTRPLVPARSTVTANPKVSAAFLPLSRTKLHASAGTGMRAPDGFEMAFTNNTALEPERTTSFDVGVEQEFAGRRALVDLTYFYNRYHDLIVTLRGDLRGLSRFQSANLANSRAQGLELSGAVRPAEWLQLSGHYTWLQSEVLSLDRAPGRAPSPFAVGQPLLRRPGHFAAYPATWHVRRWRLTLNTGATMRSESLDVHPLPDPVTFGIRLANNPGHIRPDLGAELALTREVALFARLHNFNDSRYDDALGFPALRRNFVAGLKFRWK